MDSMESEQAQIVRRVLAENRFDAERVLIALVQTITGRHVDCELVKLGRRIQPQPRTNSLVAVMDSLHEYRWLNAQTNPAVADVQKRLFEMLGECQFAAEREAGIDQGDDDDDDPPAGRMRLVTD